MRADHLRDCCQSPRKSVDDRVLKAADNRSPLGLKILSDFSPAGEGEWQGEIYNRENGKTYSCKLSLEGTDQLAVRAYALLPLFGKTLIWRRADAAVGQK